MAKKLFKCRQSKIGLALLLTLFISVSTFAQDRYTLTGVVTLASLNQPASGVSVIIKGSDIGTVTDFDGNYAIEVSNGDVIEFVYLGFKTENVIVAGQQTADISLQDDTQSLEEVVVVGYGTQKEKNLTNAVTKVGSEVIEDRAVARVEDALRGRVAGLRIRTTDSEAGGDPKITLRGPGSITGTSSPLIVVDGVALGTDPSLLSDIDNNNIDSITVLKDASSVAIYGSRGANGVILVSLKEGKAGDTKFSYNTYSGWRFTKNYDQFNSSIADERERLLSLEDDVFGIPANNANRESVIGNWQSALAELEAFDFINELGGGEKNLQDLIFTGGTTTSHSFSMRGGTELSRFSATVSYLEDEGIALVDNFKRYNFNLKMDSRTKNKKIRFGGRIRTNFTDQERLPARFTDPLRQYYIPTYFNEELLEYANPFTSQNAGELPDRIELGGYTYSRAWDQVFIQDPNDPTTIARDPSTGLPYSSVDGWQVSNGELVNTTGEPTNSGLVLGTTGNVGPLPTLLERQNERRRINLAANAYVDFKLAKGLTFKQSIAGNFRNSTQFTKQLFNGQERVADTERFEIRSDRYQYNVESTLRYKRDIKRHTIDAVGGFEYNEWQYFSQESSGSGFENDVTNNIALVDGAATFTLNGVDKLVSYFGRIQYDFDDKYLLAVSARTDGSTRFGSDKRYGFFPAASVGWNIAQENFLSNSDFLTTFKLRASYGISGANDISNNIFNSLYRSQATFSTVSYGGEDGVKQISIPNSDLGWERLVEFNPGLDLEFGYGKFGLGFDYYVRTSDDLILNAPVSSAYGSNTFLQNLGEVENKGVEIEMRARPVSGSNFSWNISGQFSLNRNEVKSLGNSDQIISTITQNTRPTEFIARVGEPITSFYGWVVDRELSIEEVINPFNRFNNDFANVYVKDLNNDGVIDDEDRTELGSPYPDFTWGFNSDFNIYDFDISFALQGSHGAEVRVADLDQLLFASESNVNPSETLDQNVIDLTRHRRFTDDHIQDGSFVALRNVTIGYTIPSSFIEKAKLSKARFYLSGENLVYIFAEGYDGFNPESFGQTSDNANTALTDGYQRGDGPIVKTITAGLNIEF